MHLIDHIMATVKHVDTNVQRRIFGEHGLSAPHPSGSEHYVLLVSVAQFYHDALLIEVGTYHGSGSLALSQGLNHVVSYDIVDVRKIVNVPDNVEFRLGDFRNDKDLILSAPFIFVDVDPHDGIQEDQFHQWFLDNHYSGLVLWDDIHLNEPMQRWWQSVRNPKTDLTGLGHWSGTGLVHYA